MKLASLTWRRFRSRRRDGRGNGPDGQVGPLAFRTVTFGPARRPVSFVGSVVEVVDMIPEPGSRAPRRARRRAARRRRRTRRARIRAGRARARRRSPAARAPSRRWRRARSRGRSRARRGRGRAPSAPSASSARSRRSSARRRARAVAELAEQHVGVGHRWLLAALAVGRGPGVGARRAGARRAGRRRDRPTRSSRRRR